MLGLDVTTGYIEFMDVTLCLAQCMRYKLYSVKAALKWTDLILVPIMLLAAK